jgi:hypothetical protein
VLRHHSMNGKLNMFQMNLDFFLYQPMYDPAVLRSLHGLLVEMLPKWSVKLRVLEYERRQKRPIVGHHGDIVAAVQTEAPLLRWGFGDFVIEGAYRKVSVFCDSQANTLQPELNGFRIEILADAIEGGSAIEWAKRCFREAVDRLPVRLARGCLSEEFDAKNLVMDSGCYAIGVQIQVAIPGMYWLNYYGPAYLEFIGRERWLSMPAPVVESHPKGVLISLGESPYAWKTPEYQQTERAAIAHIGTQYFFSRHDPDRKTVAPEFQAGIG